MTWEWRSLSRVHLPPTGNLFNFLFAQPDWKFIPETTVPHPAPWLIPNSKSNSVIFYNNYWSIWVELLRNSYWKSKWSDFQWWELLKESSPPPWRAYLKICVTAPSGSRSPPLAHSKEQSDKNLISKNAFRYLTYLILHFTGFGQSFILI